MTATASARWTAIDWMRGFVMILMTIDHASDQFDARHAITDATFMYRPGDPLAVPQFLTRWTTHLCAPTFVFLAGAGLALSVDKQRARGASAWSIDRFIVTRGLFILALDPIWMSRVFLPEGTLFQVLYALGASMVLMTALRRVPDRALLTFALAFFLLGEALIGLTMRAAGHTPLVGLLLAGGKFGSLIVAYPALPWLSIMALGWTFGRWIQRTPIDRVASALTICGVVSLGIFGIVRGANAYGNMQLYRYDGSLVQWLHVSKYPPSLTFVTLELGLMSLLLAVFMRIQRSGAAPRWLSPLRVFGETALFFYLLHAHLLKLAAVALGRHHAGTLGEAFVATAATAVVLYPACLAYGRYKRAHPTGWTRFV